MSNSTTRYPKPTREDYISGAEAIERKIAAWPKPRNPFDKIVMEAEEMRAKLFREMAERCER